jgi:hypothetical protein
MDAIVLLDVLIWVTFFAFVALYHLLSLRISARMLPMLKSPTNYVLQVHRHYRYCHFSISTRKMFEDIKKSLKIPKRWLESAYRRRSDNITAKRKRRKGQTTIHKLTHKTKDRVTRIPLKTGVNSCAPEG